MKIVFMERNTLGEDVSLKPFEALGEVVLYGLSNPEENAARIEDADVLIVNKIPMNEALLCHAKKLKLICLTATGTNNVDFAYTNQRGIAVANVKGYSTESVVQHTFAMFFYLFEKLAYYDAFVKCGDYVRNDIFSHFTVPFYELAGKQWGIIGLGAIGRRVAEVAKCFGCSVAYYSTSGANDCKEYPRMELKELLATSDVVSIHAPLNAQTERLIGEEELSYMKKDAILLNLGRGPIVDENALAQALKEGRIGGAGLDVLCIEPMAADSPLRSIQDSRRLLITPHIAWATVEARQRCADEVYRNICAFVNGEERNLVRS